MNKINELLVKLNPTFNEFNDFIESEIKRLNKILEPSVGPMFSEKDTILITYADQFESEGKNNIQALKQFIEEDLDNSVSIIHLLPFYPWTSDDGFSPVDFKQVCSEYGSWSDIEEISQKKMFDCVFNHLSSQNEFFQAALSGDKQCEEMFHVVDETTYNSPSFQKNIKKIVRPRTSDLFSKYRFGQEDKYVWTTFSKDQIDTNLNNPKMLKYLLESLFLYVEKGAKYFRIDAVPFMWKELGTNCSHLEKTHTFVQLFRAITDRLNSNLIVVTESNVPHLENISYWGAGDNEAHIIYNFSLAPLVLHAVISGDSSYITKWADSVFNLSNKITYLNFTATHDGIGMRGLEGVIPEEEVRLLCELTVDKGGYVGKKTSRNGAERPYELNITWASIMENSSLDQSTYIRKVVNSQAIIMFFPGVSAHYVHNFLGSKNWQEGFEETGIPRRLNRQKLSLPLNLRDYAKEIKKQLIELINYKTSHSLFSPNAGFQVINTHSQCLSFKRFCQNESITIHFNLSPTKITFDDIHLVPYELLFVSSTNNV